MLIGTYHEAATISVPRTGLGGKYIVLQTCLLVLFSVWSLGGRAEGAITIIGGIAWSSLFAFVFSPGLLLKLRTVLARPLNATLVAAWSLLICWLLFAPLNSEGVIRVLLDGTVVYEPRDTISWLPSTFVKQRCLEYGWLLSGVLVQTLMVWQFVERFERVRLLLTVMAGNALVVAILGAGFHLLGSDRILGIAEPVHSGFFGSFRYHNHWTAFALLSMGQCVALAIYWYRAGRNDVDVRRQHLDLVWGGALLILSFTLPMSTARAGVLFLAIFWLFHGLLLAKWMYRRQLEKLSMARFITPVFFTVFTVGIIAYSISLSSIKLQSGWSETLQQVEQIKDGQLETLDTPRTDAWGDCWRMFQDRPLYGAGFGSHRYLYQLYARDQYRYESGVVKHIKEFAHNDWMQYLAEFGIVGLTLLLLPPIILLSELRRAIARSGVAFYLLSACGLVLALATFEFPLSNPAIIVIFSLQFTLSLKVARIDQRYQSLEEEAA